MDFVTAGTLTHNSDIKSIDYQIVDIDYWENDAVLLIEGQRFYFQWDAKDHPTILDALRFLERDAGVA